MATISRLILAQFFNADGTPATGMTGGNAPLLTARVASTGALHITAQAMTEVGNGFYRYADAAYDTTEDYIYSVDATAVLTGINAYAGASNSEEVAEEIVDQAHDEAMAGHNTPGTAGNAILDAQYQGAVWIDTFAGSPGTTVGVNGTPSNPVSTLADAVTLAAALGLSRYKFTGNLALTSSHIRWTFEGQGQGGGVILNGQDTSGSTFVNCQVAGVQSGSAIYGERVRLTNCTLNDARMVDVTIATLTLAFGFVSIQGAGTDSGGSVGTINFAGSAGNLLITRAGGNYALQNITAGGTARLALVGDLAIEASCTSGTVHVDGVGNLTDNSAGATVNATGFINEEMSLQDGAITAAKIATDAIDADAIAADAIGSSELAAGAITATTLATDTITADKIATDAIDADAIAADAIGSSELAAGAITATTLATDTITADKIATDAIDADALAADAGTEIAAAVDSTLTAAHGAGAWTSAGITAAAIADAVWDELLSGHVTPGSAGWALLMALGVPQSNVILDGGTGVADVVRDATNGFMTSARLRVFPDKATAGAASVGGAGAEGAILTVTITGNTHTTFPRLLGGYKAVEQ